MTDSSLVRFALVNEATVNTTPASPVMQIMRVTSIGIGLQNKTAQSEQIDSSRMASDQILTGTSTTGAIAFEFSNSHFDKLLVASVLGTRVKLFEKSGGTECGAVTLTTTFAVNSGGATAVVGHLIRTSGYTTAANNGLYRVASSTGTTIVVSGATLSNEASTSSSFLKIVGFRGASGDITATATGLGSTTLDFTTLGLVVGQWVSIGGNTSAEQFATSALNSFARITAIAATALTLDNLPTGWTTDSGTSKTITVYISDYVRVGSTVTGNTFSAETAFLDQATPSYFVDSGLHVNTITLNCPTQDKVTGTFEMMGLTSNTPSTSPISGATYTAIPTDTIYNSSSNTTRVSENGTQVASPSLVTSFTLNVTNNLEELEAVGSLGAVGIRKGTCTVTGNFVTYFGDLGIYNRARALSNTQIAVGMKQSTKAYMFYFPRVQLSAPRPNAGGINQDVTCDATFNAAKDSTTSTNFQMDMFYEVAA